MAKKLRDYTEIGKRIAALAKTQTHIARVLGIEQQTVSKKLLGNCAISLVNLKTLSKAFKVPMTYFLTDRPPDPKLEAMLKHIRSLGRMLRNLMVLARKLSTRSQKKLIAEAEDLSK
jgi:transcriptional regulator with XRE-family HTH domain